MAPLINSMVQPYNPSEYVQTAMTGNRVSRKAIVLGSQNIILGGKCIIHTGVVLRGDLKRLTPARSAETTSAKEGGSAPTASAQVSNSVVIGIGRYCALGEGCLIRPAYKTYKGVFSYYTLRIGDHVHIGAGTVVEAANIGNHVDIGKGCVLGRFAIIKDCVQILDESVVAPGTVMGSGTIWAGSPAKCVGELSEMFAEQHETRTKDYYARFRPATVK
ncbi:hypothetical protein CBS101457_000663 [Exobasidium rhododendri]|nr:hypothetical protein CBS101457_000663 [Exobasidium rhododendri]